MYPPTFKLYEAVKNVPEFNGKTPEQLRSKLQNDFINWNLIEKSRVPGTH